jgi:hypothetical protein
MQSTSNPKEPTMKATTHKLIRLATIAAPATTLAASCGHMGWSDENLKQQIQPVEGSLARIRSIQTTAVRLATLLAPLAALAATCGHMNWSDESLKQEIQTINGVLDRLRKI